ncbi:hypothetical protein Purlil1_2766 [Purpureocillium lilacinum]|uniref:F-box domain-containing protein n=1 Tax=Purpureocillium lilacinum TaxID=33203 RepID=A0ABR0C9U8_PURLI|nr:hypothetical protein Purlil1_2766 [Purpureocillium lilacinum]
MASQTLANIDIVTALREVHQDLSEVHQFFKQWTPVKAAHHQGHMVLIERLISEIENGYYPNMEQDEVEYWRAYADSEMKSRSACRLCTAPEETLELAAAQERRRGILWAWERDLARSSLRPLKITDLPRELLRNILDYFEAPDLPIYRSMDMVEIPGRDSHKDTWQATHWLRNVQRCRLTCRLFDELASPYLLPWLRVSLNEASLRRATEISLRPHIAAGVRGVRIQLAYYYPALAQDFQEWAAAREQRMDAFVSQIWANHRVYPNRPWRERARAPTGWHLYVDDNTHEKYPEFNEVLDKCHEEYWRRSVEQSSLLADGRFVNCLAAAMARFPRSGRVEFTDSTEYEDIITPTRYRKLRYLLDSPEGFCRYLCRPDPWVMWDTSTGDEVRPAKIMAELPVAMWKAGARLEDVWIHCFPHQAFSTLRPGQNQTDSLVWRQLQDACQNLRSFYCKPCDYGISCLIQEQERTHVDDFFAAMLSGSRLELVRLELEGLGTTGDDGVTRNRWHQIGRAIAPARWPLLKALVLQGVSFHSHEFQQLCRGLGRGILEALLMRDVQLDSGSWAVALDILRGRMKAQRVRTVSIWGLEGGEVRQWYEARRGDDHGSESPDGDPPILMEEELARLMAQYIGGSAGANANPLRNIY